MTPDGGEESPRPRAHDTDWVGDLKTPVILQGIQIYHEDLRKLDDGEWLNDNIVNYGLETLKKKYDDSNNRVHLFSTHFYTTLKKEKSAIDYDRVRSWTKKAKLLDKDYVVVPVHEYSHWWMAIICNPGGLDHDIGPCSYRIITLDSLNQDHSQAIDRLEKYLLAEFQDKKTRIITKPAQQLHIKAENIPQQNNSYDCGIFILGYFE
ncbi:hypothetical protein B0J18DRAFT_374119, partial [Chaetomium sp. MPI-SDFR-AT-0129]